MELFFRKYFWTVNLVFILLVAFLAARTVNLFVEAAMTPLPSGEVAARQKAQPTETLASLDLKRLSDVTGIKVPEPDPVVAEPTTPDVDPNAAPVKSSLRVKLLGTLVASDKLWSVASIQDMNNQRSTTYMVGDRVQGAEVIDIERLRVIIINNGRKEFIDGQPGDGAAVASYTPPPLPSGPPVQAPNVNGSGIRAVGENDYEVPRSEIDRTLANLNDVAMQARIVPAFKDGQAQGFKLFSIRPDSIYSKIGVQNGDVIKRINGFDLNSPEKALEVYTKLKEASRIEIDLERNGSPVHKNYTIR
ncbi:type II secretion system protein GspC [Melittangium boletus]|uniref:General secretion pathway protein GspC n=1 Tax=Melittangium boletus DSM 14713 TaxID=1294270 RepID=A0A250I680_9BACT|nr:type II secretion system protein GspC [Melittangium boletus]ATB27364.1 general secretion pathway protein GspC [Melittangium boletus DSM 14713]